MNNNFEIIFEDDNILILNKLALINTISDEDSKENSLFSEIKKINKNIIPVFSLDKSATGIVFFVKNKETYKFICEQFKKENIERNYNIIVNGVIYEEQGEIDKPLLIKNNTTVLSEKGIKAITKYKLIEQFKNYAFVEAIPLTTRPKQIRTHFFAIGNPLAIDEIYATAEPLLLSNLKKRYKGINKEKPLLTRMPLHLSKIKLILPGKKDFLTFEAQLPKDMEITLKQLRKYNKRGF